mmetsp:Transcript_3178/g.4606  ORF Transcript_3178/g.4606 Transcript_3178/m.4606 type:complete len:83 (+) Transcript_3178:2-250(+)
MSAKVAHHFNLSFVCWVGAIFSGSQKIWQPLLCSKVLIDAMQRKLLRRVRLSLSTSLTLLAFGRDGEWMKVHLMLDSWLLAE